MGVWIEIKLYQISPYKKIVTPCVGVWIEIVIVFNNFLRTTVTPCVGVWIEIDTNGAGLSRSFVTPCVGVWIEILHELPKILSHNWSLPAWECGLKYYNQLLHQFLAHCHSLRGSVD